MTHLHNVFAHVVLVKDPVLQVFHIEFDVTLLDDGLDHESVRLLEGGKGVVPFARKILAHAGVVCIQELVRDVLPHGSHVLVAIPYGCGIGFGCRVGLLESFFIEEKVHSLVSCVVGINVLLDGTSLHVHAVDVTEFRSTGRRQKLFDCLAEQDCGTVLLRCTHHARRHVHVGGKIGRINLVFTTNRSFHSPASIHPIDDVHGVLEGQARIVLPLCEASFAVNPGKRFQHTQQCTICEILYARQ
mmetsp:Transcript_16040/g.36983  ORF Transcript_16040/g.36983 Transcript_16040/m.36983 type:complete len:244 (+) Transcript_16040:225-956(+)